eukprot:8853432-Alexandrium_andersonii.AAC.1
MWPAASSRARRARLEPARPRASGSSKMPVSAPPRLARPGGPPRTAARRLRRIAPPTREVAGAAQ